MITNELKISDEIKRAIKDMGFEEYTPIQEKAIPVLLQNKDIIGRANTGTGKTAAFAIPILEKIDPKVKKPQAIVLCPTRELALQVSNEFTKIAKYMHGIKAVAVYGGEPISRQIKAIKKGAQIIIGTPGRTIDHITRRHTIKTDSINTVILDEADEMLKMGFREDIELVLSKINTNRQTALFSATMPKEIIKLTKKYQNSPKLIEIISKEKTAVTIRQEYCETNNRMKPEALIRLIEGLNPKRCIVFCNMKVTVDKVQDALSSKGVKAGKIHGDINQSQRLGILDKFNKSQISVLVATDVAARGLDINEVDLIINYDMPQKEEYYVHRVGRSGRAGKKGHAITITTRKDNSFLRSIRRYTKSSIEKIDIPTLDQIKNERMMDFVDSLQNTISSSDLSKYEKVLSEFDDSISQKQISLALIKKSFDLEKTKSNHNDINITVKQKRNKRSSNKNMDGMVRLFFSVGKMDKVKPNHILETINQKCKVSNGVVGDIDLYKNFSFVNIKKDSFREVLKNVNGASINQKRVSVQIAKNPK